MSDLVANELHRKAEAYRAAGEDALADRVDARIAADAQTSEPAEESTDEAAGESDELADHTKAELLDLATEREIEGRYQMNKAELVEALTQNTES